LLFVFGVGGLLIVLLMSRGVGKGPYASKVKMWESLMKRFKKNRPIAIGGTIEKHGGRMVRNMVSSGGNAAYFSAWEPAVDIYQCRNRLVVCIDVSGVVQENVRLSLRGRQLVISGKRVCAINDITEVHQLENEYGCFERLIDLPVAVDTSSMSAETNDGFLIVRLAT